MSKSVRRVREVLEAAGLDVEIMKTPDSTRTAQQAAVAAGCALDQIVKSMIFAGAKSGRLLLFLTAGGNRVVEAAAERLSGEPLVRADAARVRAETGFAIGGVAPLGHLNPIRAFLDPRLCDFDTVWAAAGTPYHIFPIAPDRLIALTGATTGEFTR
ncbi:aminoacyl-tRNA deacylase [Maritimibacter sp. 55A14]|uniref:YbaK/EbsC family protein n=1 Tax=Maritimibacter sp. 55A14 TaxID=2174844 RepID=UPI000D60D218|nr:YbaK/EbsC family protein [Maritimibacter sp. 55A14]PWE34437.1 aminoacyl-tRNA deacylase [Maritimibacter sp. 55A14]